MTVRRLDRSRLLPGVASALLMGCLAMGSATQAQTPSSPQSAANASGPSWTALTPTQQSALAPLRKDWQTIDAPRKQKWLEIAARLPSLQPEERKRIQDRMTEWARMTPEERGRARLQFQEARQISPQERQARWDAYLALPADERRALANSAKSVPKAGSASARAPADGSTKAAAIASVQKNNIVTAPSRGRGQDRHPYRGAGQAGGQYHADLEDRLTTAARPDRAAEDRGRPGQGQSQHVAAQGRAPERHGGRLGGAMTAEASAAPAPAPGLRRRLAAFVYEGVLLFGVLTIAALAYGLATQQRHALVGLHGLQLFLFLVLGLYFTWFWSHGGQTVAMKTWHVRLLSKDGQPVSTARAWIRYVLSWLWFLPALAGIYLGGLRSGGAISLALLAGVLVYALLSRFNRRRQFLHDLISRTELVYWPTVKRKPK